MSAIVRIAALALVTLLGTRARASDAAAEKRPDPALAGERKQLADELEAFRSGDDARLEPLRACAARLATAGSADAPKLVSFYAALDRDQRRAGLAAEHEFVVLRDRVNRAKPETWPDERSEILLALQKITQATRESPDPNAAGRSLALSARIREQRIREDPALTDEERASMAQRASDDARAALALFERIGLVSPRLEPWWILARLDDAAGETARARVEFEDLLAQATRLGNDDYRVYALRGLLKLDEDAGDVGAQRQRVLEIAAIPRQKSEWCVAGNWAKLLLSDDEIRAAVDLLARSRPTDARDLREWHMLYAGALRRLGDEAGARAHDRALEESAGDVVSARGRAIVELERASAALAAGDASAALAIADSIDADSSSAYTACQVAVVLGRARLATNDLRGAEEAFLRAIDRGRTLEASLNRSNDGNVFGEVVGLDTVALLAETRVRSGDALGAAAAIEDAQLRALRRDRAAPSRDDLLAWSECAEVGFLTWVAGADSLVVVHVARGGDAAGEVVTIRREELREAVRRLRESAIANDSARTAELARELESRILPPRIRARLASNFAAYGARVLLLAHGPLERLPFDALPVFSGPQRVLVPMVLPGIPDHTPGDPPRRDAWRTWNVLGDPTDARGASTLAAARAELDTIGRLTGARPIVGAALDRGALLAALASGRCLHVATHLVHGCLDASGDGGLLLANGDVVCLSDLRAAHAALPLAVLAACETDDGPYVDAQALSSVGNALLAGGTRNLCVTLWPVSDAAAHDWSVAFHRALAEERSPARAALRARETLRSAGSASADWAAFRFLGRD